MKYLEFAPAPPLDELVHCIWFLAGSGREPAQPVVPDGRIDLIIHRAEPFSRIDESGMERRQASALLAGQLTAPIRLVPRGPVDVVGVRFRSAGAKSIVGLPLHEIAGRIESLREIKPDLAAALQRTTALEPHPAACAAAIGRVLLRFVQAEPPPLVRAAVRALGAPDPPRVDSLARRLGTSSRTLERQVREEVGLAPKMLQRVLRFRRAFRMLADSAPGLWGRVAPAAGYYDQAHLIRDFRGFAGAPPSAFFQVDPGLARSFVGDADPRA